MATENPIQGVLRDEVGKGAARRARREGLVPAALYGHGLESVSLNLPAHEIFLITKDSANPVVTVNYDGKKQLALVREIQRHPVRRDILHVDLLAVSAKELVEVEVPLVVVGETIPGTQVLQELFALVVSAPAISIPELIEIPVEGLDDGAVLRVRDIALPEGVEVNEELLDHDVLSVVEIQENIEEEEEPVVLEFAEEEVEEATEED